MVSSGSRQATGSPPVRTCSPNSARATHARPAFHLALFRKRVSNSENPSAGVFGPAHRATSLGILLAITAIACEGMAVATVLPSVAVDLGGLDNYGWAFSAFMLAS